MLYSLKLIIDLYPSSLYMYSIFAELRDDCLGEAEKYFVRRLRNCYNK